MAFSTFIQTLLVNFCVSKLPGPHSCQRWEAGGPLSMRARFCFYPWSCVFTESQLCYSLIYLWRFYLLLQLCNIITLNEIWVPKGSCCFCENSVDFQLMYNKWNFSRVLWWSSNTFLLGKPSGWPPSQELKEHYLPATSDITGSRAPWQGLDLGRDTESWAYSLSSQIQGFKKCLCRYLGTLVSASESQHI